MPPIVLYYHGVLFFFSYYLIYSTISVWLKVAHGFPLHQLCLFCKSPFLDSKFLKFKKKKKRIFYPCMLRSLFLSHLNFYVTSIFLFPFLPFSHSFLLRIVSAYCCSCLFVWLVGRFFFSFYFFFVLFHFPIWRSWHQHGMIYLLTLYVDCDSCTFWFF